VGQSAVFRYVATHGSLNINGGPFLVEGAGFTGITCVWGVYSNTTTVSGALLSGGGEPLLFRF
jgi:hypothetical protein